MHTAPRSGYSDTGGGGGGGDSSSVTVHRAARRPPRLYRDPELDNGQCHERLSNKLRSGREMY